MRKKGSVLLHLVRSRVGGGGEEGREREVRSGGKEEGEEEVEEGVEEGEGEEWTMGRAGIETSGEEVGMKGQVGGGGK